MNTRIFPRLAAPILRAAALLLLLAAPLAAQTGAVEGVARSAKDDAPLALLLVRLLSAERRDAAPQGVVTDAQGRFRFADVPAGGYRLQVEQIGHERTLSPVVQVQPGGTVRHEIRSTMVPIQLAGISVGGRCLTGAQLASEPRLAALWSEARKGVQTREAFALQYRFMRTLRQDIAFKPRIGKTSHETRLDTVVNEPDSIRARAARVHASRRTGGYGAQGRTSFTLQLPNELELLSDEFLTSHCLETSVPEEDGAFALRFRPVRRDGAVMDIQGAIWVDAKTYLIRRLELEYMDGRRSTAQAMIRYEDKPVAGSVLRLPSSGELTGRPGGMLGVALVRLTADIRFGYHGFERVRTM